jgi:HD-like signal output (HDOD) protein
VLYSRVHIHTLRLCEREESEAREALQVERYFDRISQPQTHSLEKIQFLFAITYKSVSVCVRKRWYLPHELVK